MTHRASDNLSCRSLTACQARRVIFCCQVAHERRDLVAGVQQRQRLLEKSGLTGTWTRYQADHQHAGFAKSFSQRAGDHVILFEDIFPHFDETWFGAHSAASKAWGSRDSGSRSLISSATTSSSFPRNTVGVAVPHSGQHIHWMEETKRGTSHLGQNTS